MHSLILPRLYTNNIPTSNKRSITGRYIFKFHAVTQQCNTTKTKTVCIFSIHKHPFKNQNEFSKQNNHHSILDPVLELNQ